VALLLGPGLRSTAAAAVGLRGLLGPAAVRWAATCRNREKQYQTRAEEDGGWS